MNGMWHFPKEAMLLTWYNIHTYYINQLKLTKALVKRCQLRQISVVVIIKVNKWMQLNDSHFFNHSFHIVLIQTNYLLIQWR